MSYGTMIYAVDLDRLKAAVGSADQRLLPRGRAKRRTRAKL